MTWTRSPATIIYYSANKQTSSALTRNTVSLLIEYARRQIADCLNKGIDVEKRLPWQAEVARLTKNKKKITGLPCYDCRRWVWIGDPYFRKRSNHNTKIYCMYCADRLGYTDTGPTHDDY